MAPCPQGSSSGDCATRTLTVTETVYPTQTMGGPAAAGWGGGPGWAVASAPPSSTSNSASVSFEGTAVANAPSTVTSQTDSTATIGLATTSSSPAASNNNANTKPDKPDSGHITSGQVAGSVIGAIAGFGLLALLLFWCCRGKAKPRLKFKIKRKNTEDKERLREAEEIAAERELALRDLENRRRERETGGTNLRGFDFGSLGPDHGHANSVEPVPRGTTTPRSPRWI